MFWPSCVKLSDEVGVYTRYKAQKSPCSFYNDFIILRILPVIHFILFPTNNIHSGDIPDKMFK